MKRIVFEVSYCDPEYLLSINSENTCKSRAETWEFFNQFEMSGHYDKEFINLNNLRFIDDIFDNKKNLLRKDNEFLFINSFDDILNR